MSELHPAPSHLDGEQDEVLECFDDAAGQRKADAERLDAERLDAERRDEALRDAAMMAPEPDFSRLKMAIAKLDAAFAAEQQEDG